MSLAPSFDGARNGDAMNSVARHGCNSLLRQKLHGKPAWRPSARVQPIKFAGLRVPVNEKQIAAHPVAHWVGDAEYGVGSNGGVHCRSAFSQNLRSSLRGQVMTGGDDASLRHHN